MNLITQIEKKLNSQKLKKILIISIILLFPFDLVLLYGLGFINRIYPNIYINDQLIGGKHPTEAIKELKDVIESNPHQLILNTDNQKFVLNQQDIDLKYDLEKTIFQAYNLTREGNLINNAYARFKVLQGPSKYNLLINFDENKFDQYIASISAQIDQPAIPPTIDFIVSDNGKNASVSAGKTGKELNVLESKILITQAFQAQNYEPIILPVKITSKEVSQENLKKTQEMANSLIDKELILEESENQWILTDEEMINYLSIYDTFDEDKIASWAGQLAKAIDREPQNALFEFEANRVKEFQSAKPGIKLKKDQAVQAIQDGIKYLANQTENTHKVILTVDETQPAVTNDQVNDMGIKELIGKKGESWFPHSIAGRIHNVALAASQFHGILKIPAGETLSFVENVGEIDAAHGYQQAYIIKEGKTILGDGGGVCQVSTTLFRAALNSGLEIVERRAHAYRVSYYEENYQVGVDATVFTPSVDLKFKNDTNHHILIQAFVDQANTYMRFDFYGTKDGRVVEISESRIWDQAPPPPPRYQDDPSLPAEVIKQIDWAAWGAKTAFDWKVTKDDQILHEKTFFSTYQPWQAVYLKGTGGV